MSKRRASPRRAETEGKAAAMGHRLTLDRFEEDRDGAKLAVLVLDDGRSIVVPSSLLPAGAAAGASLTLTLTPDPGETAAVIRDAAAVRADLKKTDPGGTIQL